MSDPILPEISWQSPVFLLNSRRPLLFAEPKLLLSPVDGRGPVRTRARGGLPQSHPRRGLVGTPHHRGETGPAGAGQGAAVVARSSPVAGGTPPPQPGFPGALWSRLRGEFAEFLQYYSSIRLSILCAPTGVGLRYSRSAAERWIFFRVQFGAFGVRWAFPSGRRRVRTFAQCPSVVLRCPAPLIRTCPAVYCPHQCCTWYHSLGPGTRSPSRFGRPKLR